ncbi:MAG: carboxypeptidase regulatory-like domain-containing protein [Acidobacteria bacterium]|nr:carboxypeptidase regulatory-like domain-containing protein [Acidobacteriota bacterium]MBI3426161.1 carboxypeptidase regulatory-like domain-containing protein [Acidobacteriota bacterium]
MPLAGVISGTVFRDWNGNGKQDPATAVRIPEVGIGGITVTAYNTSGNAVGTATAAADGSYSLTTNDASNGPYRVEFTNIPAGLSFGPAGMTSGTAVQFVATAPSGSVSLGLNDPKDYCQDNPFLGVPCYVSGDPTKAGNNAAGPADVLVTFPYAAGTSAPYNGVDVPPFGNQPSPSHLASAQQTGADWGVAYQRSTRKLFTAAVVRRHSGFGPLGIGGIYTVTNPGSASPTVANFVDVKTIGIDVGTLTNATRNLPADRLATSADSAAFSAVGKQGIGDLEISEDDKTLWLINLNDRKLYSIFINDTAVVPTAANVSSFTVPSPNCNGGTFRPWAVKPYKGKVYVGGTCTAETSQTPADLKAAIYEFTPGANTFVSKLEFGLGYTKGITWVWPGVEDRKFWRPWTDTFDTLVAPAQGVGHQFLVYPQPVLSGIEFDIDGSMILGFMDRTGMQTGFLQANLSGTGSYEGISGGDTLRAYNNNGAFVLENNGVVGPNTGGTNNGQGPGGGEFYYQEDFIQNGQLVHQETSLGALGLLPGALQVVIPVFDPFTVQSGGVLFMNNFNGKADRRYEVFPQPSPPNQINGLFGKAAGLGDLEVLCDAAPIELGNRIWNDLNRNGIQDANEAGRAGVTVQLFKGGQLVGTTTTSATGQYFFNADNVSGGVVPNMAYEIRVNKAQQALTSTGLSPANADNTANGDQRDSDAVMNGTTAVIAVTTGGAGANDHSNDLGFFDERVDLSLTKAVSAGPYAPGQNLTYTLLVSNATDCTKAGVFAGPCSTATNVTIADAFPAQLTFVSANPAAAYNAATNVWTVGTLAPGASATIQITATVKAGTIGNIRNFAQVQTQDGPLDIDSTPGNRNPSNPPAEDDEAEVTINIGPASLGDRVWVDKNGNGCQDQGEVGLAGVTVMLLDGNGATLDTKTTDANGNYLFSNLAAATYSVKFTAPSGYAFTKRAVAACGTDKDSDADVATGRTQNIALGAGQSFLDLDAGVYQPASLGDCVWNDMNRDGLYDASMEVGVSGVSVRLFDESNTQLATTTTNASGKYSFANLPPGNYYVIFGNLPQGFVFSPKDQGNNEALDSDADPATGRTAAVMLMSGQNYLDLDAGIYPRIDLSLTKTVSSGPYISGQNVTYTLTLANAANLATATNVTVRDVLPAGLIFVSANASQGTYASGTWTVGSVPSPGSVTLTIQAQISAASGSINNCAQVQTAKELDLDSTPGNFNAALGAREDDEACVSFDIQAASLGDFVWLDLNANGCQDAGEPGVPNVTVTLFRGDNTQVGQTTTNAQGGYSFNNLAPGDYYVIFALPAGYTFTSNKVAACGDTKDSDANTSTGRTQTITLAGSQNFPDLDAGVFQGASVGNYVFKDANLNGVQDDGAANGVNGVIVRLFQPGPDNQAGTADDVAVATSTTTNNGGNPGFYLFTGLTPGRYFVQFDISAVPDCGFIKQGPTGTKDATDSDPDPANGRTEIFTLANGENDLSWDAGLYQRACVSGFVYEDTNDNGLKEAGEAGIKDVTVTLTGTDLFGNIVSRSTLTSATGAYQFCNLVPGTYKLTETQPPIYVDGKDTAGSLGGTVTNDMIADIPVGSGANGINYNFGELLSFDLSLRKEHTGNFLPNTQDTYMLTVTNKGPGASQGTITVTDNLPGGMTYQSVTGAGWSCSGGVGSNLVTCTYSNTLAANASTSFTLRVRISQNVQCAVVNVATLSAVGDTNSANNIARDTTLIDNCTMTMQMDPGNPALDPGSILIFPVYTSDASNPNRENTQICLTNTNQKKPISVHLFFVDGTSCAVSDSFVCLTQNQTACFLTSDIDPGTMGYIVAVATDDQGCPTNFNWLIGDEYVKFASGHYGNLRAESFPALSNPVCDPNSGIATLPLDGITYRAPGRTLAASSILSRVDDNSTLVVIDRVGGNLATTAATLSSIFGVLYDDAESPFSFSINSPNCQLKQVLTDSFPRTTPRFTQVIPAGRTGWIKFAARPDLANDANIGIIGAVFNFNPNATAVSGAFTGGRALHKLTLGRDVFTIPVFPPSC